MRNVQCIDTPRIGQREYEKLNIRTYPRRVFGMFEGERQRVTMVFDNSLLDTVVDRLGAEDVMYHSDGDKRFVVNAEIEVSPQFYAWIFGFGDKARIKNPAAVVEGMKEFLKKVTTVYE